MLNFFVYKIGQFLALQFPLKVAYGLAVFISDLRYLFAFADRRAVTQNLQAIFPNKTKKEIAKIRLSLFRNFAKYLVDFFRFTILNKEYVQKNIKIENLHYYQEELKKGNGVIALTAHLGNWELGGAVIGLSGYNFWAVVLPHKHKKVSDFFNAQRASKGVNVMNLGNAARQCLGILKKNYVLALVGDRDFSKNGDTQMEFFGKPACLPSGAAVFSLKTQAPIIPGFMIRNPDDTFTLKIEKPIEFKATGDREKDIREIMKRYVEVIEKYVRQYPDQWYMFRRFWI